MTKRGKFVAAGFGITVTPTSAASTEGDTSEPRMQRRPRQDPISCQLCRTKKLKCNRQYPCSNCTARGVTCRSQGNITRQPLSSTSTPVSTRPDADILRRLERLEAMVLRPSSSPHGHIDHQSYMLTPATDNSSIMAEDRSRDDDTRRLEDIGTREDTELRSLSDHLIFEIRRTASSQQENGICDPQETIIQFPDYTEALQLFEIYEDQVDHIVRVLHLPSVRKLLYRSYDNLKYSRPVQPGDASLLLAVFAFAAFLSQPTDGSASSAAEQKAVQEAMLWCKAALDALEHSRRTTSGVLADVQASILISFLMYHVDGFSVRGRLLVSSAITIGRDLRLHRIDEYDVPDSEFTVEQRMDREIKRRVWWHLVATDWILASFGGPQEGIYFVHPQHMRVARPNECSDEDLSNGRTQPAGTPSPGVLYLGQRIRFGELCREIVDVLPIPFKLSQVQYDRVMAVDGKIERYLADLPAVLRMFAQDGTEIASIDTEDTYLLDLRYYIHTSAYSRRCKLHQPFLIRQDMDPRFSYSRSACLDSARNVFRLQHALYKINNTAATNRRRLCTVLHFMHLALVVMVMDLCFNQLGSEAESRKHELQSAFDVFRTAGIFSPLPGKVLNSMNRTLQKHGVNLSADSDSSDTMEEQSAHGHTVTQDGTLSDSSSFVAKPSDSLPTFAPEYSLNSEDFLRLAMEDPQDLFHWDDLFSGLDTTLI